MQGQFDIGALVGVLRRRWLFILVPVLVLSPLVAGTAYILPSVYRASARVLVQSQQIPSDLVQSTIALNVGEQVAFIEQRLMTRQNLIEIAQKHAIRPPTGAATPTAIVELMRSSTEITPLRLTGSRGPINAVEIAFNASSPTTAANVANEFLDSLLSLNVSTRSTLASETTSYFRQEVRRLSERLGVLETEIAAFKQENEDALPDSLSFRRSEMNDLEQRVFERELQQIALEEEKKRLTEALQRGEFSLADATGATPEQRELARLRQGLLQQRSLYAESHPSIRALKTRIENLEALMARAPAETPAETPAGTSAGGPATQMAATIDRIDQQLRMIDERRTAEIARAAQLATSIERTPAVELDLRTLERAYASVSNQYQAAVLKLTQAESGERLEINQKGERFEVLERAETPVAPSWPPRRIIAAGGVVGSAGLGVALMLLAELLNRALRTAADVERQLGVRPIVVVPYIATARETAGRRRRRLAALVFVGVVVPGALFLLDRFYAPLPLLAEQLMNQSGLNAVIELVRRRIEG